jgi:ADP-heptose:LPS heptosyltransferase
LSAPFVVERVLVIKLGALGDFVQATGPFAAVRRHHAEARITLLTTPPFAELASASGWFDDVWTEGRPGGRDLRGWLDLRRRLRGGGFGRVYDLQTSPRSSFYSRLFWPGPAPEWSGIAVGCSHPHANPRRDFMHTLERQAEQLALAGVADVPPSDFSWVKADVNRFALAERFALVIPGGAIHRPAKRWPAERFAQAVGWLAERGIQPVLLGGAEETELIQSIAHGVPGARSLAGGTSLFDIAALARGAVVALGNDTGPMHVCALAGCPSVVLFSDESDPALCAQRGPCVTILRHPRLAELGLEEVVSTLARVGAGIEDPVP